MRGAFTARSIFAKSTGYSPRARRLKQSPELTSKLSKGGDIVKNILRLFVIGLITLAFSSVSFAQATPATPATPPEKSKKDEEKGKKGEKGEKKGEEKAKTGKAKADEKKEEKKGDTK
jgi:hypothetical protein